jgi:hypothetical protein
MLFRTRGLVQVVQCWQSKHKVISSNPITTKKKASESFLVVSHFLYVFPCEEMENNYNDLGKSNSYLNISSPSLTWKAGNQE